MGYVNNNDVKAAEVLPEMDRDEDVLEDDWDTIE